MRAIATAMVAVFIVSAAVRVMADIVQDRETCATSANICLDKAKIIEKRVRKLKDEIKRGKSYPPNEMKLLEQKLRETLEQLDKVEGKNR